METSQDQLLSKRATVVLRVGLGALFLLAGLAKLFALDVATQVISEKGLPAPGIIAVGVGIAETCAGLMLLAAVRTRSVARVLMVALVFFALVVHDPFGLPPGVAHANAIALTVDILVLLGLVVVARVPARRDRIA
jgi:uncharacterized membrane protein YphA (DoxX/SURF4 family)